MWELCFISITQEMACEGFEVRGAHQNPFASVLCSIIANLSGASLADDGWYLFRLRGVLLTLISSGSGKLILSTPHLLPV